MCMRSGRPFWDSLEILSNDTCLFDFAGPSSTSFGMTFFWPYVIIMFGLKYYKDPKFILMFILLGVLVLIWVDIYFYVLLNGINYMYQMVIGQLVGFTYLVGVLSFDNELHKYALRVGFSMRSSRSKKFSLLFTLIGLFVFFFVLYAEFDKTWT